MIVAGPSVGEEVRQMEAGCDDYDTKPVELPRLLEKIAALLAGRIRALP